MPDPASEPAAEPVEVFDEDRARAKIAKANQEAKSLRDRLKIADEKATRLDELEASGQSEVEKLTAKVAEAERNAQEANQRAMRAEVASAKGLTAAQAKRLVGGSLEELEADADELLESFKPQEGDTNGTPLEGKPSENLRSGGDPTQTPEITDPAALADMVPRGF